jgi:hypothetical protein
MFICDRDGTGVLYAPCTLYTRKVIFQKIAMHSLKKQRRHKVYFSSILFGLVLSFSEEL